MPAPRNTRQWTIKVSSDIADRVERALYDGVTGKPLYGGRGALISSLLSRWLAEREAREGQGAGADASSDANATDFVSVLQPSLEDF